MKILEQNGLRIINMESAVIGKKDLRFIEDVIGRTDKSVAIDLSCVTRCVTEFFEVLKEFSFKGISLVNVDSMILSALYMTGYDRFVHVYEDNISLIEGKNEIIKRRFAVV